MIEDTGKELSKILQTLYMPGKRQSKIEGESVMELFENRLRELQLSQNQVEVSLKIEKKTLNNILQRKAKRVDIINILKLAQFLDITTDEFVTVYLKQGADAERENLERSNRFKFVAENFDLKTLKKVRFLSTIADLESIEKRIIEFFRFRDIYEYADEKSLVLPAFSRTKRKSDSPMRDFWVKSAYVQFEGIANSYDYNREDLVNLIPKIRPYTMNLKDGLLTVIRALYHVGVTVIYQPALPNVQVRGATFVVGGKPCIVLSDIGKKYPTLWFSLLHELHHVLYDLEEIEKRTYHLTGIQDLYLIQEEKADEFARDYLFSKERTQQISSAITSDIVVEKFAQTCQVHPSIIYNYYMYDRKERGDDRAWSLFANKVPDSSIALRNLDYKPWEQLSLDTTIKQYKDTIINQFTL